MRRCWISRSKIKMISIVEEDYGTETEGDSKAKRRA